MANPGEQVDLGAQIAAKFIEHNEALAAAQRTAAELRALMASAGIIVPGAGVELALDTVEPQANQRPFPGLFSSRTAPLTAIESYESTNGLMSEIAQRLSPYQTELQADFSSRTDAQPAEPQLLAKLNRIRSLSWSDVNYPIAYGYSFKYSQRGGMPALKAFDVAQSLVDRRNATVGTRVAFTGHNINEITVDWSWGSSNLEMSEFPDALHRNLGSRDPAFDDHYKQLMTLEYKGKTIIWPANKLTITIGDRAQACRVIFAHGTDGHDGRSEYSYHEDLADGPAFVRTKHATNLGGPTTDPEQISLNEFLGWVDFALSTIPPNDLPIGPRGE